MLQKTRASVGLDIGGSSVKIGYITEDGEERIVSKIETGQNSPDLVLAKIAQVLKKQEETRGLEFKSIGIGFPGQSADGVISSAPNLPNWIGIDLKTYFLEKSDLNLDFVGIENDANLAAFYEYSQLNLSQNDGFFVLITLGTGIGGGLIFNGEIYSGAQGFAGEIGHICVDPKGAACGCGKKGCVEKYFSLGGLKRLGNEELGFNIDNPSEIFEKIYEGDLRFKSLFKKGFEYFSQAMTSIVTILNPSHIVLGGGMSYSESVLLEALNSAEFKKRITHSNHLLTQVSISKAKNDAGVFGGALWSRKKSLK